MIVAISASKAKEIREDKVTYKMRFRANSLIDVGTFLGTLDIVEEVYAILSIKRVDELWAVRVAEIA